MYTKDFGEEAYTKIKEFKQWLDKQDAIDLTSPFIQTQTLRILDCFYRATPQTGA